jgi:hypothetical protein
MPSSFEDNFTTITRRLRTTSPGWSGDSGTVMR